MNLQRSASGRALGQDEIRSVVGSLDEEKILSIANLNPTWTELEEAVRWAFGDGDILAKDGRPMSPVVSQIVEIIEPDEDDPLRAA